MKESSVLFNSEEPSRNVLSATSAKIDQSKLLDNF
jgi:hypothetical protein